MSTFNRLSRFNLFGSPYFKACATRKSGVERTVNLRA